MKKIIILFSLFVSFSGFSQITIFQDSFDGYNDFLISGFGQWQTLDIDLLNTYTGGTSTPSWPNNGDPQAFQIFNPTTALVTNATNGVGGETENRNFNPRTGSKYAACWSGVPLSNGQTATSNNDWLISPPINLTGVLGTTLSIWVKSMSDTFGLDTYKIGVYSGSGTPASGADFTIISGATDLTAPYGTWAERTQSLAAYNGQTIRIGINCTSSDTYMFMVDDFKVTATSLATDDFATSKLMVYPNPSNNVVTVFDNENIGINTISISDYNGRKVKFLKFDGVNQTQINISELNSGLYFMKIETNYGILLKKMIKN